MEIGGTVGDIESLPFLEAIRQLGNELGRERTLFVHLTLVPYIAAGELKTKPTQHSVKELRRSASSPISCSAAPTSDSAMRDARIALFCNVRAEAVIPALDVRSHLRGAAALPRQGLDDEVCRHFGMLAARART